MFLASIFLTNFSLQSKKLNVTSGFSPIKGKKREWKRAPSESDGQIVFKKSFSGEKKESTQKQLQQLTQSSQSFQRTSAKRFFLSSNSHKKSGQVQEELSVFIVTVHLQIPLSFLHIPLHKTWVSMMKSTLFHAVQLTVLPNQTKKIVHFTYLHIITYIVHHSLTIYSAFYSGLYCLILDTMS